MLPRGPSWGSKPRACLPKEQVSGNLAVVAATGAVLLDIFRTAVAVDFDRVERELAETVGVPLQPLRAALGQMAPDVAIGALTMAGALERALRACGSPQSPSAIAELVARDREALVSGATVYDDVVPFLAHLQRHGIPAVFVSNCAENTRPLLEYLGLAELVEGLVLSCEVGAAKPSAEIFERALGVLGVGPADALLVDDQVTYCDGAAAIGIRTVRIDRALRSERPPDRSLIGSLDELLPDLGCSGA